MCEYLTPLIDANGNIIEDFPEEEEDATGESEANAEE